MNSKAVKGASKKRGSATPPSSMPNDSMVVAKTVTIHTQAKPKTLVAAIYTRSALVEELLSRKNSKFTTVTPVLHGRQAEAVREAVLKQLEEDKDQLQVSYAK